MNYGLFYNKEKLGDILFVVIDSLANPNKVIKKENYILLYKDENLVGINLFDISKTIDIKEKGYLPLVSHEFIDKVNSIISDSGVNLPYKEESGFVISKIIDIEEHPESDHLHICTVDVGKEKPLQIVCGAFNARLNLVTVCALPYTFMPNGSQIIPSKLLGIESFGMLCSERELAIPGFENKKGLIELDDNYKIGSDFFKK